MVFNTGAALLDAIVLAEMCIRDSQNIHHIEALTKYLMAERKSRYNFSAYRHLVVLNYLI